jgi:hypothetical protein
MRPYQVEANTAIEQAIRDRKRKMLVAIATGTGGGVRYPVSVVAFQIARLPSRCGPVRTAGGRRPDRHVRNIWNDQLTDTERLLEAFEHARPAKGGRRAIGAVTTAHAPAASQYRPSTVADESHRPSHGQSRGPVADPGLVGGAHAAA